MLKEDKKEADEGAIRSLVSRKVVEVIDKKKLEEKLKSGKKLTIKLGRDARVPTLHLGHSIPLRKLREFQRQGHQIVIVLGDFTSRLGDPSDDKARDIMQKENIDKNVEQIRKVFDKVLDPAKTKYVRNSQWLGKLDFGDVIELASHFTVQQNIDRDLFQRRLKANIPIGVHEFLYPIMQAYDSVVLKPDLELGGTDQTFNLLAGRTLMRSYGLDPQDIMTTPMLEGTDGREMHSSRGNFVGLDESEVDMFGKLMGIRDELIIRYFELTTDLSEHEVGAIAKGLQLGNLTPLEAKKRLAHEIVTLYHGAPAAAKAQDQFEKVIQAKGVPEERGTFKTGSINILDLLQGSGLAKSKSEARRLVDQGGVDIVELGRKSGEVINRMTIKNPTEVIVPKKNSATATIIQVGKRNAVELTHEKT